MNKVLHSCTIAHAIELKEKAENNVRKKRQQRQRETEDDIADEAKILNTPSMFRNITDDNFQQMKSSWFYCPHHARDNPRDASQSEDQQEDASQSGDPTNTSDPEDASQSKHPQDASNPQNASQSEDP